jgi:alkaline phosphatase D
LAKAPRSRPALSRKERRQACGLRPAGVPRIHAPVWRTRRSDDPLLEIADLLAFIKREDIRNVHWITADVHYAATHRYDPNRAQFSDFLPFYEFVSGPLCAGGFGPNLLDKTFGPQVVFQKVPPAGRFDLAPSEGSCHFGHVKIDGRTGAMTVTHHDAMGGVLHALDLAPT